MTLETGVKELAEAVGADVKALEDGKVDSNDTRLTDSREWTAGTVSQSEAEAGSASTRRAWTAQRVRQAINAWWQLVTSGFGRNFIAASNEQAARNVLQLGTAAAANLTTSNTDITAGRVLKVGDFGVGGSSPRDNSFDANDLLPGQRRIWHGSFTEVDAVSVNLPALGGSPTAVRAWSLECVGEPTRSVQYATEAYGTGTVRGRTFVRVRHDATWHPWQEIIRTSSLLQATGSSTDFPMSQAATTLALNEKVNTTSLGTAATYDVGEATGQVMQVGAYGLGEQFNTGQPATQLGWDAFFNMNVVAINSTGPYTSRLGISQNTAHILNNDGDGVILNEELLHSGNILSTTGQSTDYPMSQKAVTDAINARGFADASGILTVTSGALSNDMSSFLSQTTKATMRSNLEVPQLNASATQQGGLKARLDGTTLYLSNDGTNP